MMLAHPDMENVLTIDNDAVSTLVIENRDFFNRFLRDVVSQMNGSDGVVVLSEDDRPVDIGRRAELIDSFLTFTLNRKSLLTKINNALEKTAVSPDYYVRTQEMIYNLEDYIDNLAGEFSCNLSCSKITPAALVKAGGVTITEDYDNPLEQIFDYMELVREFDRERLFIFINMRTYFNDEQMTKFFKSVLSSEYMILLIDGFSSPLLQYEKRLTIDEDLCEF